MQRAGAAAAAEIVRRFADRLGAGVLVATGPGTTGATAGSSRTRCTRWGARARGRVRARAHGGRAAERDAGAAPPACDASATSAICSPAASRSSSTRCSAPASRRRLAARRHRDAVESLTRLADRGAAARRARRPDRARREHGDSSGGLRCELTITFGTIKRGPPRRARTACGTIVVVDIGLGAHARGAGERMRLASAAWFAAIAATDSCGGAQGHAERRSGSSAARRGWRGQSCSRRERRCGAEPGLSAAWSRPNRCGDPGGRAAALASTWPADDAELEALAEWADTMLIGPGLGGGSRERW
jgi:hypothetical protein